MEEKSRLYVMGGCFADRRRALLALPKLELSHIFCPSNPLHTGLEGCRLFAGQSSSKRKEKSRYATQTYYSDGGRNPGGELRWPYRIWRGIGRTPRLGEEVAHPNEQTRSQSRRRELHRFGRAGDTGSSLHDSPQCGRKYQTVESDPARGRFAK